MEVITIKKLKLYKSNYLKKIKSKKKKQNSILKKIITIFMFLIALFFILDKRNKRKSISINNIKIFKNKTNTKIAMCVITKTENRYIKYFLKHYNKLGYDHIYLYDNNDIKDEPIESLSISKDYIKTGFLTIIEFRNKTGNFQADSYHECYKKYNSQYDWLSFYDMDEYLILEQKNLSIQEFLDNPRFNNCESVQFNWKVFTDNELLDFEDISPIERFPIETAYSYERRHVKSIIRGGLDLNKIQENGSPHTVYSNVKACTSSGKQTKNDYYYLPPDLEYGALNHYVTKTINEYFFKRYKTKSERDNVDNQDMRLKKYWFDYFFKINKKTKEKVDIYNKLFHTNYQ